DPPVRVDGIDDAGCVLHEGVGNVELLIVAIVSGADRTIYAGPVFSHYEFETPLDERVTNGEGQARPRARTGPPRDEWTRSYAAPGANPEVVKYEQDSSGK